MVRLFLCFIIPGEWNPQPHPCENLKTYMFICLTNFRVRATATNRIIGSLGPRAVPDMVVEKKISWLPLSNEPQFSGCPAHNSVRVLSELCHVHYKSDNNIFKVTWDELSFLFTDHTVAVTTSSSSAWKIRILLYLDL